MRRAIVGPERKDRRGRPVSEIDPVALGESVADPAQVFGQKPVEVGLLRRIERGQGVVRRLGNSSVPGGAVGRRCKPGVAPVTAGDRVHRIEDGDVNDRKCPRRAQGAGLLGYGGRNGSVIERVGIECDLIPAPDRAESGPGPLPRRSARLRRVLVTRPKQVRATQGLRCRGGSVQAEENENQC